MGGGEKRDGPIVTRLYWGLSASHRLQRTHSDRYETERVVRKRERDQPLGVAKPKEVPFMRVIGLCELILSAFEEYTATAQSGGTGADAMGELLAQVEGTGAVCHGSSGGAGTATLQPVPMGQGT